MILNANPKLENNFFSKVIKKKISQVIKSGKYILGDEVKKFEKKFSNFIGSKYAVGVNSGTDALIIALKTLGVSRGDEVIIPAISASATAIAVKNVGAKIIYADLDLDSQNVSAKTIQSKISKKTKAIIVVHLHGLSADIISIKKIIKNTKIKIIEDCAQSHGSKLNNKYTGNLGDIGCFSFYPTKNLNCIGDGGAITTNSSKIYNLAKRIRQYGWASRDDSKIVGMNSRLDEIQAAILLIKLKKLFFLNNKRRKIAKKYLQNIKKSKKLILPKFNKINNHVFHHFVVRLNKINRSKLIKSFLEQGIQILVHYKKPLFEQKALNGSSRKLVNTSKISKNIISLPIYPNLKNGDIKKIYRELNKYA
jgi:dTDP-4-amino-4,6-dideoxygalactose transaminase